MARQLSRRNERTLDVVQGLLAMASIVLAFWIAAGLAAPRVVAFMPHLEKAIGIK